MKKILALILLILTCISALADYTVSNVKATPISPWGVSLTYTLKGSAPSGVDSKKVYVLVTCEDKTTGKKYESSQSALSGDTGVNTGTHQIVWNMAKDGHRLDLANAVFSVEYKCEAIYVVIDLSGGPNATSYPVTYLINIPSGGWTDEYKTTKLVLRYIKAGKMPRTDVDITLTKDYYIGVFEVTQKQYELVTGSNPSYYSGDKRPVDRVSYNNIRGSSNGSKWPASNAVDASSFLGKLRARTGLTLDLPTEAQWEYACRAGSSGTYGLLSTGKEGVLSAMGWYYDNGSQQTHDVGGKTPNALGLYDMHGNVCEWCLDWYKISGYSGTDPKGASSGSSRVQRGAGYMTGASDCTASYRDSSNPSYYSNYNYYSIHDNGFRLAIHLDEYMVVDLSGGPNASSYPVSYMAAPPADGWWSDEYKTTKLVLRKITAGKMPRTDVDITLTEDYYVGVFEVTQKQYELVMGSNPSSDKGEKLPVMQVSYDDIRGSSNGSKWPASNAVDASSFLGKLRPKTGLVFDLPTEAQWEYASRAGSSGDYGLLKNGQMGSLEEMGWYEGNSGNKVHDVGEKTPNAWGLYDMHGNEREWCLDWHVSSGYSGTDPVGASSGSYRVMRGGGYFGNVEYISNYSRRASNPSNTWYGFRLTSAYPK